MNLAEGILTKLTIDGVLDEILKALEEIEAAKQKPVRIILPQPKATLLGIPIEFSEAMKPGHFRILTVKNTV